ncbi:MAB_1171c family putative transporter [Lentzea sp. NPDC051838]|uniref:MAB_1171c family putative transporter n=1 Tax=Lentzea sp. NPDC051838 TaxID=3154849 RepID=UPI00342F529D
MSSYATAALLTLIGLTLLGTARSAPRHLVTFFLSMALSLVISGDPTIRLVGVENQLLCRLVTNVLQLLSVWSLLKLARSIRSPEPRTAFWPLPLTWAVLFLCYLDFAPHHAVLHTLQWRPSVVLYQVVLTGYAVGCLVVFIRTLLQVSRPPGAFRTGLRVIMAAAAATIAWGVFSGLPSLSIMVTGLAGFVPTSRAIGMVAMTLWVTGALLTTWDGAVKLFRTWRGIRAVTPLWRTLVLAQPQIALPARHDLEFTLYRRVIEIRDGLLALRTHVPPDLASWLRTPVDGPTLVAAELAAALVMRDAGRSWPAQPGQSAGTPSVEAETAWLGAVSSAFTRSPVVREVRRLAQLDAA